MKHYQIVIHSRSTEKCKLIESLATGKVPVDPNYMHVSIPTEKREDTTDLVQFQHLQVLLARRTQNTVQDELDYIGAVQYLWSISYLYRYYGKVNLEMVSAASANLFSPSDSENEKKLQSQLKSMASKMYGYATSSQVGLYSSDLTNSKNTKSYLTRLKFDPKDHPQDILQRAANLNIEKAKHATLIPDTVNLRHCDDPHCTLNTEVHPKLNLLFQKLEEKVLASCHEQQPDKSKPLVYCGFASGLLLRDFNLIKKIIDAGFKNLIIYLIDSSYAGLIKQISDGGDETDIKEQIEIEMTLKAVNDFANLLSLHADCDETHPLQIHLFSDPDHLNMLHPSLWEESPIKGLQKINILVGIDFFIPHGTLPEYDTPGAHESFMDCVRTSLDLKGKYFEMVKDDMDSKIYLNVGHVDDNYYTWDAEQDELWEFRRSEFTPKLLSNVLLEQIIKENIRRAEYRRALTASSSQPSAAAAEPVSKTTLVVPGIKRF